LRQSVLEVEQCRYMVYQLEIGESGTPHLQGYVEFTKPWRFNRVRRFLKGAHIEPRKGTRNEARAYCMKEEGRIELPVEYGDWIPDCARIDVAEFHSHVMLNMSDFDLLQQDPVKYGHYGKSIERIRATLYRREQHRRYKAGFKPFVICVYGTTGTGKSRTVCDFYGIENVYIPPSGDGTSGSIWWEMYHGEQIILLDDFYGGRMKPDYLLRQLDYPRGVPVQTKGGVTYIIPQIIIMTSNTHPHEWYKVKECVAHPTEPAYFVESRGIPEEVFDALMRRFDYVLNADEDIDKLPDILPPVDHHLSNFWIDNHNEPADHDLV
jgi:hypothetical protein